MPVHESNPVSINFGNNSCGAQTLKVQSLDSLEENLSSYFAQEGVDAIFNSKYMDPVGVLTHVEDRNKFILNFISMKLLFT